VESLQGPDEVERDEVDSNEDDPNELKLDEDGKDEGSPDQVEPNESDEIIGITTDDPMCFAVQIGKKRWLVVDGTMSCVDGLCHKIEFPGFKTRSGAAFGISATFHVLEKAWQDGTKRRGDIQEWVMLNGRLQSVETIEKEVEIFEAI
jgi:hypothetical protein